VEAQLAKFKHKTCKKNIQIHGLNWGNSTGYEIAGLMLISSHFTEIGIASLMDIGSILCRRTHPKRSGGAARASAANPPRAIELPSQIYRVGAAPVIQPKG